MAEGDRCILRDCEGTMEYGRAKDCSCNISPPCRACVEQRLTCSSCGEEELDET